MPSPEDMKAALARKRAEREAAAARSHPPASESLQEEAPASRNGYHGDEPPPEDRQIISRPVSEPLQPRRIPREGTAMARREYGVGHEVQRALPHSVEAEQGVLGSMIIDPRQIIPLVRQRIDDGFFYVPAHQTVYTVACNLFADEGMFDLVTLTQHLRDLGQLDAVGGVPFVTSLYMFVPTSVNIAYYLEIVREKYILRQIIAVGTEAIRRAYEEQDEVNSLIEVVTERFTPLKTLGTLQTRLPCLKDLSLLTGENKPPRPPELVEGVLHQGSKLIVGGTSKGRKTYSLLDLAISVATGTPWWGFECQQGPVCYINFEIQESFFAERVETICKAKGVTLPPGMLMGWNLRGHGEGIERLMEELLVALRTMPFVLSIFDPIYKALGDRDENKAGDVASMLNELEKIAVQTGSAIGFGAHYSKGNQAAKESIDRIGGSGVFARDPDSILTMTPHAEPDAFTVDATLRNFRPLPPFVVKWDWPLFTRNNELDPEELKQQRKQGQNTSGQFKAKYTRDLLLEELSVIDGLKPSEAVKRLGQAEGVSRSKVYEFKNELQAKGLLIIRDGEWYRGKGNGS